jgi:flagellar export protein FliJ
LKKFQFRLEKVLEYRGLVEQWAKDAFMEARMHRLTGELELTRIHERGRQCVAQPARTLADRMAMQNALTKLDDDERAQHAVIQVLMNEEIDAMAKWQKAKQEHEILVKMRGRVVEEWTLALTREEQAALDEWAVLRHAA